MSKRKFGGDDPKDDETNNLVYSLIRPSSFSSVLGGREGGRKENSPHLFLPLHPSSQSVIPSSATVTSSSLSNGLSSAIPFSFRKKKLTSTATTMGGNGPTSSSSRSTSTYTSDDNTSSNNNNNYDNTNDDIVIHEFVKKVRLGTQPGEIRLKKDLDDLNDGIQKGYVHISIINSNTVEIQLITFDNELLGVPTVTTTRSTTTTTTSTTTTRASSSSSSSSSLSSFASPSSSSITIRIQVPKHYPCSPPNITVLYVTGLFVPVSSSVASTEPLIDPLLSPSLRHTTQKSTSSNHNFLPSASSSFSADSNGNLGLGVASVMGRTSTDIEQMNHYYTTTKQRTNPTPTDNVSDDYNDINNCNDNDDNFARNVKEASYSNVSYRSYDQQQILSPSLHPLNGTANTDSVVIEPPPAGSMSSFPRSRSYEARTSIPPSFVPIDNSSSLHPTASTCTDNSLSMSLTNDLTDGIHENKNTNDQHNVSFGSDSASLPLPYFPYLSLSDKNNRHPHHYQHPQKHPSGTMSIATTPPGTTYTSNRYSSSASIHHRRDIQGSITNHSTNNHHPLSHHGKLTHANDANDNDDGYDSQETTVSDSNNRTNRGHPSYRNHPSYGHRTNDNSTDDHGMDDEYIDTNTNMHHVYDNDEANDRNSSSTGNSIIRIIPGNLLRIPTLNMWNPTYSLHTIMQELRTILCYYAQENLHEQNDSHRLNYTGNDVNIDDDDI